MKHFKIPAIVLVSGLFFGWNAAEAAPASIAVSAAPGCYYKSDSVWVDAKAKHGCAYASPWRKPPHVFSDRVKNTCDYVAFEVAVKQSIGVDFSKNPGTTHATVVLQLNSQNTCRFVVTYD